MRFTSIDDCQRRVADILNGNGTSPNPGLTSFRLSYPQCLELCGTGYGTYPTWSVVSSLADWVIPLFLILGNITYSKSSSQVFAFRGHSLGGQLNWIAVISHLLANPLDFLGSLALKLDSGRCIKERIDQLMPQLEMTPEQKKDLCGVCYALEDFEDGKHVDALLQPLEDRTLQPDIWAPDTMELGSVERSTILEASFHWAAIKSKLRLTARNIANDRRHNKFHSVLAILVYGKDVFVALIQAEYEENFPYQMPHTLALRQLYYWLFCAIVLSAAAGGFADQWSSHAFLNEFLEARLENLREFAKNRQFNYKDIQLDPIEPWNGGNYSWRYPKKGQRRKMAWRKVLLLLLTTTAVAIPVVIAFIMSWYTPTIGLGDRGIAELSFAGMWILNWIITMAASLKWKGKELFRIYWWNTIVSLGSLIVLFAAFQGWYNNCASWSGLYSLGSGAYIDLNMKETIEAQIFSFYLPMTGVSLFIQFSIAGLIIWMNWEVKQFTIWSDRENGAFIKQSRRSGKIGIQAVPEMIREFEEMDMEVEIDESINRPGQAMAASEQELPQFVLTGDWNVSFE